MKSPELPYSWGIEAGDTLFVAGATARDPDTYQPVAGGVPEQMQRIMGNIGLVLDAAGMDYSNVANCRVFLDDPRTFGGMNDAYRRFFPEDPPTRATVEARLANPLFTAEVQCVASRAERSVLAPGGTPFGEPALPGNLGGGPALSVRHGRTRSGPQRGRRRPDARRPRTACRGARSGED